VRLPDSAKSVPVQIGRSVPAGEVGHIVGCNRISKCNIDALAVEKFKSCGLGITLEDIQERFCVTKPRAQRSLKHFHTQGILFTAQYLISQGIHLIQNTNPQQYFPSCIRAEIIENLNKKNSVLVEATWVNLTNASLNQRSSKRALSSTLENQKAQLFLDVLMRIPFAFCEEDLGVKRDDIGILAADRAQLYFKGKWMDVGLKEIEQLSMYGIALLIIEKEGVAEQLSVFADEKRIALLNTRGFLTEYAEILSNKSEKDGCNIAILTDFDASGLVLAAKAPNAYRIGIDFGTLQDLGLDIKGVEEEYKPGNHLEPLQQGGKLAGLYPKEWIDYITTKRIEINSITEALNDNEKFWDWIVGKLRDRFTDWDYTRAVSILDYAMPKTLQSLNESIEKIGTAILKKRVEKLKKRLSHIGPGLLFDRTDRVLQKQQTKDGIGDIMTISEYEEAIAKQSRQIVESALRPLLDRIKDLNNHLLYEQQ
jgi:hypothetical protein